MMLDHRQHHLEALRSSIAVALYPIQNLANLPQSGGEWLAEGLSTRRQLQEENASLRTQHLLLQAQLQKLEGLHTENMRLRELLDSPRQLSERVLIAEIMTVDLKPFSRQIVINKGSRSNVYEGQPILDANGVMGQVISVTPFTSVAMIISDPSHAVPVSVNRNGLRAVAIGTGTSNRLDIPHVPNNADIRVGDLLVTSGLGGRFPRGYPVAEVIEVTKDPAQPFAKVTAQSTARLDRSREALLVWRREDPSEIAVDDRCGPDEQPCPQHETEAIPEASTAAVEP